MSTRPEQARHFLPYPKGEPQPIAVPHQGLQYWGEVLAVDRWDPMWGRPLEYDSYFRIVLLGQRGQVPSGDIRDSRIAACIPGRGPSKGGQQLDRKLASIRETQAGVSRDTLQAHDVLRTLSGAIPSPNLDLITGSLNQISRVCSGGGYAKVYALAPVAPMTPPRRWHGTWSCWRGCSTSATTWTTWWG